MSLDLIIVSLLLSKRYLRNQIIFIMLELIQLSLDRLHVSEFLNKVLNVGSWGSVGVQFCLLSNLALLILDFD